MTPTTAFYHTRSLPGVLLAGCDWTVAARCPGPATVDEVGVGSLIGCASIAGVLAGRGVLAGLRLQAEGLAQRPGQFVELRLALDRT